MQDQDSNKQTFTLSAPSVEEENVNGYSPPDGGYGWVVVFASFMCNFIVDGIIFSFGILLLEMSTSLKTSKGTIVWIGSLQAGFYLLIGPIVSLLANKYGCRKVTICGSLIAFAGFISSCFATNFIWLCFTFGVLGGIGFGLIYLPAIVTVGHYFESKRAFATGIAVCGSGIGAFLMAPIVQLLTELYGWRGCVLILSAFILHCAVFGGLFRPLDECVKPTFIRINESQNAEWIDEVDEEAEDLTTSNKCSPPPPYSEVTSQKEQESILSSNNSLAECASDQSLNRKQLNKNDILHNLEPFFRPNVLYSSLDLKAEENDEQTTAKEPSLYSSSSSSQLFDLTLLRSPSFIVLAISGFLTLAGFFIPFMYIVDKAVLQGITREKAALILSTIGVTNTIGRVFCGWVSDRENVSALLINNISLVTGGVITLFTPIMCTSFTALIVYGIIFGFSIACFAALRSVIAIQLLGLHRLTNAFGLLLLPQGIATIIGAPLAGWFYDATGSHDSSFYIAGALIMLSGVMCFPLFRLKKWETRCDTGTEVSDWQIEVEQ